MILLVRDKIKKEIRNFKRKGIRYLIFRIKCLIQGKQIEEIKENK